MAASIPALRSGKAIVRDGQIRHLDGVSFWLPPMFLLAALVISGCGGSEPEPSPPPETPPTSEESAARKPESPREEPPAQPAEPSLALPEQPPEQKPPRPESVLEWTTADYLAAREDRDPRLVDAVAFLGEEGAGDEQTARLLAELLTTVEAPLPDPVPQPKEEPPPPKPKRPRSDDEESYDEESYEDDSDYEEDYSEDMDDSSSDDESYDEDYSDDEGGSVRRPAAAAMADVALLKPAYVSLTGAIIQALGANGTELSRQTLQQVLAGMIETGNDRAAAAAVLKALVDRPCPEKETLLLQALTQPEVLRPAGQGEVTAAQLRETAMDLVVKTASPAMRMELAKYLFSANPAVEIRDRLVSFVMASHPYNLKPQTAIYQRPQTSPQVKQNFEVYFTTYSSSALAFLLGMAAPPQERAMGDLPAAAPETPQAGQPWVAFGEHAPPPSPAAQAPLARPAPVARPNDEEDYSDDSDDEMDAESDADMESTEDQSDYEEDDSGRPAAVLRDLGEWASGTGRKLDAESAAALAQLALNDPDLAAVIAGELWNARFSAAAAAGLGGIASLESGSQLLNLASTIPNDAARAALWKALQAHRQEGPQGLFAAAALPDNGTVDPGFLAVLKTLPRQMPDKTKPGPERPEHQWLRSSRTLLRYLCDGFRKAAEARGGAIQLGEEDLGFKIHEDANVVAAYKLDWQQDVGAPLSTAAAAVDPLAVRYVRIQDNTRYSRMIGYYRRAVAGAEVREIDNVAWIDSYRPGSDAGRMRSVDVVIARLPENTDPRSAQDEPLEVEILWVEINNPAGQQAASAGT